MKKLGIFILIVIISIILSSIYGILHNQVSYSISTEYFTKFKFEQFGFWDYAFENNNQKKIAFIGILSTWWFGLLIGLINGFVGLIQRNWKMMWKSTFGASIRTLGIAIGFGILGIIIGKLVISNLNVNWNLPKDLINQKRFLISGTMHNFSYLGGLFGLIYGIIYQLKLKKASA